MESQNINNDIPTQKGGQILVGIVVFFLIIIAIAIGVKMLIGL